MTTPEFISALETAAWPIVVGRPGGMVLHANRAAAVAFSSLAQHGALKFSALFPSGSDRTDRFLAELERAGTANAMLRVPVPGENAEFQVAGCVHQVQGQAQYVVQFFPPPAASNDTVLFQKTKLDCALQLARTVALDFNNTLTSILGHTSLVLSALEPDSPWRGPLLEVEKSASRAAEIANDLGTFSLSEKPAHSRHAGNLNALVERTVQLFRKEAGADSPHWTLQLDRRLFEVRFEEAKLQQALMKILENAVQAATPNGQIHVSTRNLELAEPARDRSVQLAAGTHVCVEVSDSGPGIAPEHLPRIFEPFFTTKGGQHRGIGLALAYGIVTNHGGGIAVSSNYGSGTTARLYLPAESRILAEEPAPEASLAGSQTVMVVDDEDLILTLAETVLTAYGYQVIVAGSGQEALDLLSQSERQVDLLVTDLVMPGMSGRELAEHVQAFCPRTRVLRTSGYVWPAGQKPDPGYLQKPFTSQELLRKVKQALA